LYLIIFIKLPMNNLQKVAEILKKNPKDKSQKVKKFVSTNFFFGLCTGKLSRQFIIFNKISSRAKD
jgi:predicted Co/Zn/Cd cation transporter (cation efflux family)